MLVEYVHQAAQVASLFAIKDTLRRQSDWYIKIIIQKRAIKCIQLLRPEVVFCARDEQPVQHFGISRMSLIAGLEYGMEQWNRKWNGMNAVAANSCNWRCSI